MNTVELIRKKRNGISFTDEDIKYLINGFTKGEIPDYQFSALLMAMVLKGMNAGETASLTDAMLQSGEVININDIKAPKIDKHSTGGVGDKTSLIIAPIVASVGIYVPMISGRGLGHTGGTLDKLESIPGFRTNLTLNEYKKVLKACGAVLIGQTKEIAPADKLIYSLRDVTGTVESIPLITGSIMSKKLAEGIDGLILDVKTGSGAFMKKQRQAEMLAESLIMTAKSFNKKVIAFITDMNQPLGNNVGNWLEIVESINVLKGIVKNDLTILSLKLAGAMIYLGKKASSLKEGEKIAKQQIENGKAFEKFLEIVEHQEGDTSYITNPKKYPKPKFIRKIFSDISGYISEMNTYKIGMAALELGSGRKTKNDAIDHKAGIIFHKKLGNKILKGDLIAVLHSDSSVKIKLAQDEIANAVKVSKSRAIKPKLIKKIIY